MISFNLMTDPELTALIEDSSVEAELFAQADAVRRKIFGKAVYIRGLIEFTNYCKNDCYYCGIRAGNPAAQRYRLEAEDIWECCAKGYALGFRTFVLQGGEDPYFTNERISNIVRGIKNNYPDCAVTLSVGEQPLKSYRAYREAGADRYLLRHETADPAHYRCLHPAGMDLDQRKACLRDLKKIGFQVGSGFMVGSPFQTTAHLLADLRFLQEIQPDMIGIGPFIPQGDTPFAGHPAGNLSLCLRMIAILRLMFPHALIPATTALGTIHPEGREMGLKAGANVVMPNLSPVQKRGLYTLYDHKINTGAEAAEGLEELRLRIAAAGYEMDMSIGHAKGHARSHG